MTPHDEARRAMRLTLTFDVSMAALAMLSACVLIAIYFGTLEPNLWRVLALNVGFFTLAAFAGFSILRINKQVWRHMGGPDARRVASAVGLSTLLYFPAVLILNEALGHAISNLTLAVIIWIVLLFLARMYSLHRSTNRPFQLFKTSLSTGPVALLVGDEKNSAATLRRLEAKGAEAPVRVLGLIETGGAEPGRAIRGVPVMGGMDDLEKTLNILKLRYEPDEFWVAVAGEARSRAHMKHILKIASSQGAKVMALGNEETSLALETIRPADLLPRPERHLDDAPVRNIIKGARILVTGGGGTIGAELSRQVAALDPAHITIFDASEYNLYSIDDEIRRRWPDISIDCKLGDVRDVYRLRDVMQLTQPDIVIHAAALKHVPLMEQNVCEAILTNVAGAVNAAECAAAVGAKRFVFISTDKAVNPDNVMGATKRLAEIAVSRIAAESEMAASMVRFGNVLGSSGSVVPLFEKQISAGGPVTVTDVNATRYFMTVEEASALVLQAAALQNNDDAARLFVLDMGDPMPIIELAEAMIRLKGFVPGRDIMIKVTGLRPGEKMHESLTYEHESVADTKVSGVMRVTLSNAHSKLFTKHLSALLETAGRREREEALRQLGILVPEYGKRQTVRRTAQPA